MLADDFLLMTKDISGPAGNASVALLYRRNASGSHSADQSDLAFAHRTVATEHRARTRGAGKSSPRPFAAVDITSNDWDQTIDEPVPPSCPSKLPPHLTVSRRLDRRYSSGSAWTDPQPHNPASFHARRHPRYSPIAGHAIAILRSS